MLVRTIPIAALLLAVCAAVSAGDEVRESGGAPTAAELVKAVQASEQWVHEVDGLRLRLRVVEDASREKSPPGVEPDIDFVFGRDRYRIELSSPQSRRILVWNGKEARSEERHSDGRVHYAVDNEPYELLHYYPQLYLAWLRAAPHPFWWRKPEVVQSEMRRWDKPEEFELLGMQEYRGESCRVVRKERSGNVFTWFIGKSDGMLRRMQTKFSSGKWWEEWMDDYREIAPGRWLPFEQGHAIYEQDAEGNDVLSHRSHRQVIEVEINPHLSAVNFDLPFEEGVQTTDYRYGPRISYDYVEKLPEDKLNELLKEAREREAETVEYNKRREAFVGRPAAPFPKGHWINSQPLDWEALKGKPVILEFWATSCGPCRSDFPKLNKAHESSKRTGVVVIGVHDPMPKEHLSKVEAFVKEHKLQYPIFVEDLPEGSEFHPKYGHGVLDQYYEVRGIPHSVVIDAEGKVASWGHWAPNAISHAEWLAAAKEQKDGQE